MKTLALSILLVSAALLSVGCKKNPVSSEPPVVPAGPRTVFILDEGNFQRNNSEISAFLPDSGIIYNNIFKSFNGIELGDTGNNLTLHNGVLYIVVNGSNKIEMVDARTKRRIGTITCPAGASPRAIAFDGNGRAYISNLYRNSVSVYDTASRAFTGEIAVGNNPEQLLVDGGFLYVANSGFGAGRTVSVVNLATGAVAKELRVSDSPVYIERIASDRALVLCTGAFNDFNNPNDDTPGKLFTVDLRNQAVTDSITLEGHPQRITVDNAGNAYTVGAEGIMKIDLAKHTFNPVFIPGFFYSLLFDAKTAMLYVTDPLDYTQPGRLYLYTLAGVRTAEYNAGVIPGTMVINN